MAKDIFHDAVRSALEREGWIITDDPLRLSSKGDNMDYEIDLGAERILAAERGTEKIAVEIKSFLRPSLTNEFHTIFGQYLIYQEGLLFLDANRTLYLAIPSFGEQRLNEYPFMLRLIERYAIKIIVFDEHNQTVLKWKN